MPTWRLHRHLPCKASLAGVLQPTLQIEWLQQVDDAKALEVDLQTRSDAAHTCMPGLRLFDRALWTIEFLDVIEVRTQGVCSFTTASLWMTNRCNAPGLIRPVTCLQVIFQLPHDEGVINEFGTSKQLTITFQCFVGWTCVGLLALLKLWTPLTNLCPSWNDCV